MPKTKTNRKLSEISRAMDRKLLVGMSPFILLAIFCFYGCRNHSYETYQSKKISDPWPITDTLEFQLSTVDIENKGLELEVRHSGDFKYENIYLQVLGPAQAEVISFPLADQRGKWIGKRNGNVIAVVYPLENFTIEKNMNIRVVHQAREDELEGVEAVGVGIKSLSN